MFTKNALLHKLCRSTLSAYGTMAKHTAEYIKDSD